MAYKAPELQRLSVTVKVLRVGVLSVRVMSRSNDIIPKNQDLYFNNYKSDIQWDCHVTSECLECLEVESLESKNIFVNRSKLQFK
jgi:hypothetical protein